MEAIIQFRIELITKTTTAAADAGVSSGLEVGMGNTSGAKHSEYSHQVLMTLMCSFA